ncbi:hypothetical protein [Parasitella parasitica]|uniref:FAD dependent oxidoreductase domain-containing protein n=1 Tax=Parasitella parasitica TaxID=35722 RepID=A0A0B7NFY2_9FUNG|nr:hypothetical protein [Parasitella parasitica]
MIDTDKPIIVVGAGVIGLSVALQLREQGYKNITSVAKYIPGDVCIEYTSPYAGAHWRTMAPNSDKLLQKFDAVTYDRFMDLAHSSDNTGIMIAPSYDYYDDALSSEVTDPWFKDVVQDFEFLTEKEDLPHGAQLGHKYTTVLINTPVYIAWLASKFKSLGGKIVQRNLGHIDEVLSAKEPQWTQGINYVIPRSDGTVVLGGTANKHDFNPFPETQTNNTILEKTFALCPELKEQPLEIVKYNVGLRPSRIGGVRIENEMLTSRNRKQTIQVTHGYGHGGFGVQSSWGSAEYIVQVMENGLIKSTAARL